jgi:hypothetical protein
MKRLTIATISLLASCAQPDPLSKITGTEYSARPDADVLFRSVRVR